MNKILITQPDESIKDIPLEEGKLYKIGRAKANDIILTDESVSRHHAQIGYDSDKMAYYIEDMHSANGVIVNDKSIKNRAYLMNRDIINIGMSKIVVELEEEILTKTVLIKTDIDLEKTTQIEKNADLEKTISADATQVLKPDEIVIPDNNQFTETSYITPPSQEELEAKTRTNYSKLITISKKNKNREYSLDEPCIIIGRANICKIQLDDRNVSTNHAKISIEQDGCFLEDLNSLNGTFLNGRPINEKVQLKNNDRIRIGETILKYIDKSKIKAKGDTASKTGTCTFSIKNKKVFISIIGGLVLFILLIFIIKYAQMPIENNARSKAKAIAREDILEPLVQPVEKTEKSEEKETSSIDEINQKLIVNYFETGNEFLNNLLWEQAIDKFQEVIKIDPNYQGAGDLINRARFEIKNREILENGMALINNGKIDSGIKELKKIDEKSIYNSEALLEINYAISTRISKTSKSKQVAVRQEKPAIDLKKANNLTDEALLYYRKGKLDVSLNKLNEVLSLDLPEDNPARERAVHLKKSITDINSLFKEGYEKYQENQKNDAFKIWSDVLSMDNKLVGSEDSYYSNKIVLFMADEYSAQAKFFFDNNNYTKAFEKITTALNAKPDHPSALEIKNLLKERAKKLYEAGYILEELNPELAIEKWIKVLEITSPEDEYNKKAKEKLGKYK